MNNFTKTCPVCDRPQSYNRESRMKWALKRNVICRSCAMKGRPHTIYDNSRGFVKGHSPWNEGKSGYKTKPASEERKRKVALKSIGNKNSLGAICSMEKRQKIRTALFNKPLDEGRKTKISIALKEAWKNPLKRAGMMNRSSWRNISVDNGQLELLEKWNLLGFNFEPNYQVKKNGFWCYIDGYDKDKNVIIEYDSKYHFSLSRRKKDLMRQQKIIDILHPKKFWRYNAVSKQFNNVLEAK